MESSNKPEFEIATVETNHGRGPDEKYFHTGSKMFGHWPNSRISLGRYDISKHREEAKMLADFINENLQALNGGTD